MMRWKSTRSGLAVKDDRINTDINQKYHSIHAKGGSLKDLEALELEKYVHRPASHRTWTEQYQVKTRRRRESRPTCIATAISFTKHKRRDADLSASRGSSRSDDVGFR
jgi:hypothetical protein